MAATPPDFLGIGATHAGKIWLADMLYRQPQLQLPAIGGKTVRGTAYWSKPGSVTPDQWRGLFARRAEGVRSGEIAPTYSTLAADAIRQIHAICPEARLIFVLRNPVERAWTQALRLATSRRLDPAGLPDAWFLDAMRTPEAAAEGDYAAALYAWSSVFPATAMMIVDYDRIATDPRGLVASVCRHIGVSPEPVAAIPEADLARGSDPAANPPVRATLVPALVELCQPRVRDLSALLRHDFGSWLRKYGDGAPALAPDKPLIH